MLASIQKITKLTSIPNADRIMCARVLGWDCIVRKEDFKEGDLCIFIEPDTIIPKKLVDDSYDGDEKIRLRVIKMKKQISQGLVLPITLLKNYLSHLDIYKDYIEFTQGTGEWALIKIGGDLTECLKIEKYEKPLPKMQQAKGNFPSFLRKTDEVNIQSEPELLEQLKGKPYYITQKMDGTSGTYFKWKGKFGVCSRNLEMKDPNEINLEKVKYLWDKIKRYLRFKIGRKEHPRKFSLDIYWSIAEKYKIKDWLPENYAIQGEICGPNIQGNKVGLKEIEMFIFNVWDIKEQKYLDYMNNPKTLFLNSDDKNLVFVSVLEARENFEYSIEKNY